MKSKWCNYLLKTRDVLRHFCMEMSKITKKTLNFIDWLFPNEKGFSTTFLLKVMSGGKKVIKIFDFSIMHPIRVWERLYLHSFKKGETLPKTYIINKMIGDSRYGDFVQDGINPADLSLEFPITVRFLIYFNSSILILDNNVY